jgi:pimeloyl-ACP methyl ester carboxylesterase
MPIEPYALNLSPSPTGNRFALAVAYPGGRPGIGIEVRSVETDAVDEVAALNALRPVSMAWDECGRRLAIASDSFHAVWSGSAMATSTALPPSQWLEFDTDGLLWGLSGERLWSAVAEDDLSAIDRDDAVVAVCVQPLLATVRRRLSRLEVRYDRCGRSVNIDWPLTVFGRPRILGCRDGRALFVGADCRSGPGRVRLELARIDTVTGEALRFFEGEAATGVGWPQPTWAAWTERSVLLAAEVDDCTALFLVRIDTRTVERIGPPGFEITGMSAAPGAGRVAIIGTSIDRPDCHETALVVYTDTGKGSWQVSAPRLGVNAMPAWDRDGRKLFFVHSGRYPDWRVAVEATESFDSTSLSWPESRGDATAPYDFELAGPRTHAAALLYIAGPHRRLVDGGQSTFFHHAILSLMGEFADQGYAAVCLNPPGATGRGRAGREPVDAWSSMAQQALATKVRQLESRGIARIAIVAGSLGSVPALHFLRKEALAAAVLISPVYGCRLQPLDGWQHLFPEADRTMTTDEIAGAVRTPVLVVHGLRDELVPSAESSRFVANVPKNVGCEYMTLPDEGHIFSNPDSWHRTLSVSRRFLCEHLQHRAQ